ncbi:MAG TPA: hypothetical protein PL017_04505 [Tenuifilaceae bacterium]|nr:hypothetical protein [Tenuifilaceae bacterium]HPJ45336.1 hypothetical protein [Tenuifilaceae bacterium]HPQ33577.1 hypothetical protein [Tenuifilaceae bacterium]
MARLLLIFLLNFSINSGSSNYVSPQEYFGESYDEALKYCRIYQREISRYCFQFQIDPKVASSVIFPELIRYNRFRDMMETTALELAYVSMGADVADFSIGYFQMKPSFIEKLEREIQNFPEIFSQFPEIPKYPNDFSESQIRNERISRLKKNEWQLKYLVCFVKIATEKYSEEILTHQNETLMILSSAYNAGLESNYEHLKSISNTKTFPYGNRFTGRFSYFDVANYYYTNHSNQIFQKP